MPASNTSLRAVHANGSVAAADVPLKVETVKGRGFRLKVRNTGAAAMEISFDSGRSWYPIPAASEFAEDVAFHFFYLRSTGGTTFAALMFEG